MRVLRSENRVSGAKCRRADDDAFVRKSCIGKHTFDAVSCLSVYGDAGVFGNVQGNAGQKGGYRKRARGKNCVGRKYVRRRKISAGAGARCGAEKRQKAVIIGRAHLQAFEARPTSFNYSPRLIPIICPARFSVTRVFRHPPRVIFSPRFAWFSHPPRLHLIQYFNVRFPLSAPRILGHPSACRYRFA